MVDVPLTLCSRIALASITAIHDLLTINSCPAYNILAKSTHNTAPLLRFRIAAIKHACLQTHYSVSAVVFFLILQLLPSNGPACHILICCILAHTFLLQSIVPARKHWQHTLKVKLTFIIK
jgi:hypothetical protein